MSDHIGDAGSRNAEKIRELEKELLNMCQIAEWALGGFHALGMSEQQRVWDLIDHTREVMAKIQCT